MRQSDQSSFQFRNKSKCGMVGELTWAGKRAVASSKIFSNNVTLNLNACSPIAEQPWRISSISVLPTQIHPSIHPSAFLSFSRSLGLVPLPLFEGKDTSISGLTVERIGTQRSSPCYGRRRKSHPSRLSGLACCTLRMPSGPCRRT